jgi:hypothetical protein
VAADEIPGPIGGRVASPFAPTHLGDRRISAESWYLMHSNFARTRNIEIVCGDDARESRRAAKRPRMSRPSARPQRGTDRPARRRPRIERDPSRDFWNIKGIAALLLAATTSGMNRSGERLVSMAFVLFVNNDLAVFAQE